MTDLAIMTSEQVDSQIRDEEIVIGVEIDGDQRAYAINMMGRPETELLNDTLYGRPIGVTFCNTCQSAIVFSRQFADQTLTLFLSGELINKSTQTFRDLIADEAITITEGDDKYTVLNQRPLKTPPAR